MEQALTVLWLFSLLILMGYYLVVFRIRKQNDNNKTTQDFPGVSIVIAVKNGGTQFLNNLENILSQDYPVFEIMVVDDHSDEDEKNRLEEYIKDKNGISLVHNAGIPGKKHALKTAIEKAQYDLILCTDADCRPVTSDWIRRMVSGRNQGEMVLGYSPYQKKNGWLSLFVRFETVMTGIQYLSWAWIGKPYMGVGRNMLYPKHLFLKNDPYKKHHDIPYGDDDLWVQQAASMTKVAANTDPASFVYSDPPHTWRSWLKQKHRHLSAGHHYIKSNWWQPGLFGIVIVLHWILFPLVLYFSWTSWIGPLFYFSLLIRWVVYAVWTRRLGDMDTVKWYPILEIGYAFYLAGMGWYTIAVKKKSWN
jgi:glycosyltransferase involved in cell wall biosynthesis